MDISVLIVSWNSELYIKECLSSICSGAQKHSTEVILVDNESTDQTLQIVSRDFPEVRVIETNANLGFARAINLGSKTATGRYLFLLNPDSTLGTECIDKLADFLESCADAGAVSPKILDEDGIPSRFSVRQFPSLGNTILRQFGLRRLLPGNRLFGRETLAGYDRGGLMAVPCVSGAAIMLPRLVFDSVGGLNEELPMYFEDLELCARIGKLARLYCLPEATVVHLGRKSAERSSFKPLLAAMENGEAPWMYLRRYHGLWHARAFTAILFIGSLGRLFVHAGHVVVTALLRHPQLERAYSQVRDALAVLKWCVSSRQTFLSSVASAFAPSGRHFSHK